MNQTGNERYTILIISLACIGLTVESIMLGWEFWVPPVLVIGIVFLWAMYILGRSDYALRRICYAIYTMFAILFHGVHESSFFDVSIVMVLGMSVFVFLNSAVILHVFMLEYAAIMAVQLYLAVSTGTVDFNALNISRIVLHVLIVILVYRGCLRIIRENGSRDILEKEKDERIRSVDADMEDFLTNISHELRTPVNVVNGMSEMLIKKNVGSEAESIKAAGIRLAYQIEDIQDYTECKRNNIILEEDIYMSTSLINDVVTGFRMLENEKKLELIVDMDPNVPSKMIGDVKKLHKIFRHILGNAVKFTRRGGIYLKVYSEKMDYGVNLCIEMTDTGIGMDRKSIAALSEGMYQVNKRRNRSSGGIGLGLFIVYGFAHRMGGFVSIDSEKNVGTTVRVTIPQKVTDEKPCLTLSNEFKGDLLFHVRQDKYAVPRVRDFYRAMATNLATGIRAPLYPAQTVKEIEHLMEKLNVSIIFMGQEEYEENSAYFDDMSKTDIVVAVSAEPGFKPNSGSRVIVMPKPLYAYPVIKILNEGKNAVDLNNSDDEDKVDLKNVRALVVDDEPMNLVVAIGLFKEYEMLVDTAGSGKEGIRKYRENDYDVVFMDHMMPEMDGVEAMKLIKAAALELNRNTKVIALTANAVSGAREMFIKEGFDGFIAKPINIADFERVMKRELSGSKAGAKGMTE